MRGTICLIVAYLGLVATASVAAPGDEGASAPTTLAELDARLADAFKQAGIPGASVAIIENGQIVLAKGYGFADVAARKPATADSVFRAGSISKSLTGIAIMTLVEEGKLSLGARLADLAPEVKFENPWEATDPVRLVHLLEHSTGWPNSSLRVMFADGKGWSVSQCVQYASPEFVSRWRPGLHKAYSNAGPLVAGLIVERASGQPFDAYVRDQVLRPMGMATGDFALPPALASRLVKSYDILGAERPDRHIILAPSGSLAVSARELAQLVRFFLGRGSVDGRQILTSRSVERIERSESTLAARAGLTNGYGLGNFPIFDRRATFRGHNGGFDSFTSVYGYSLRNASGYVLMANGGGGVNFGTPSSRLIRTYLTRSLAVRTPPVQAIDQQKLERFAGIYRVITPIYHRARLQDAFSLTRVSVGNGKLIIGGNEIYPTGPHTFRYADGDEPHLAFVEEGGATFMLSSGGSAQKDPLWRTLVTALVGALLALGGLISVVMLPVWLIAGARGRLKERGGWLVRLLPAGALLTLVLTLLLPGLVLFFLGPHQLTAPSPSSIAILVCSVLFPLLAALALWRSLRATGAPLFVRLYAGLTAIALLSVAGYATSIGWVGLRTWTL